MTSTFSCTTPEESASHCNNTQGWAYSRRHERLSPCSTLMLSLVAQAQASKRGSPSHAFPRIPDGFEEADIRNFPRDVKEWSHRGL
ncbi:hypothetical protein AMATHDRAFT_58726 [Amanita thiersii Skay4041]|uniref:Uncharacterized protein n=1 Tax=Amanita thiersii Skay4041 TaxID=703135 RepID=A0A2A9NV83_9AGAR|nr:hypothetical protein AMATHDRAFT_58726 [Amanita thiersii Skay4041]